MTVRTVLADTLEALFAATTGLEEIQFIRAPRTVDELSRPIAQLRTQNYAPLPAAPLSKVTWSGTLTLASPHRDLERAEDQLEELLELVMSVSRSGAFLLGEATLVAYGENADGSPKYLALDINVTSIFNKE